MSLSVIPYMRWAKSEAPRGEFLLTSSAVPALDWTELGFDSRELELARYSRYGEQEMLERIGSPWNIPPDNVLIASSTTHAHFCFAASGLEPGDRVLVEAPGYTPLVDALSLLKLQCVPFQRSFETGYALPQEEIRDLVRSLRPRMIIVTHLHNPSGVALTAGEARFLGDLCDSFGAEVLNDEIYRPFLEPDPGPLHAVHPSIISVWGLNKVHGLPLIRVGWGLARPERVDRARIILDATTVHNSTLSDQVGTFALRKLDVLARRARRIAAAGWQVLRPWLAAGPLEFVEPAAGLITFPRVPRAIARDGDEFRRRLLEVGVGVTPGRFFGAPEHIRIGHGLPLEQLTAALARITRVLEGLAASPH